MENETVDNALDVFVMSLFVIASIAVSYAGYTGLMEGLYRAAFPFIAGMAGALYFGRLAWLSVRDIIAARKPDSPDDYGENGWTLPR